MQTQIALHYHNAIVEPQTLGQADNTSLTMTMAAEMMNLGFVPTKLMVDALRTTSEQELEAISEQLIGHLNYLVGNDVNYEPLYPNFPQQVIDAEESELFLNALIHYLSMGEWTPSYYKVPREVAFERTQFKKIDLISDEEFNQIFTRVLSSNDSISTIDKQTIRWFVQSDRTLNLPEQIPFKENLCYFVGVLLENGKDITSVLSTATDVLRVATYLSDGDISLAEPTKFRSLSRKTRRQLVNALEQVATAEDIARHRNKWIKLFHNLHVGDHSKKVYNLARKVRNNEKIQTFNGRVQEQVDQGNILQAIKLLEQRPGEFARRLDLLVRKAQTMSLQTSVISAFLRIAEQVPTRMLLQLAGHFQHRDQQVDQRVVFPKGNTQHAVVLDQPIPALNIEDVQAINRGIHDVLFARFGGQSTLGNVWVDPQLDRCPIPTQMRSASESLNQVARGTRLPFGDETKNTLRFFIYWVGQDIDLSASFHDEEFNMIERVAYTNLRSSEYKAYHSGDITNARNGASEFIDIDIEQAAKHARYVTMNVLVFTGPSFAEHEKVYAGWMTRSKPKSNEVYDPTTVEQKVDLTANSRNSIPIVFDLIERKAIWTDLNTRGRFNDPMTPPGFIGRHGANNVEVNKASIEQTLQAITTMSNKISLHQLFTLHGMARGSVVQEREEADIVFGVDQNADVTPYNIDVINSEYVR